ncbi:MAG: hypothetical protein RLZZ142_1646, partial [Verrucomicrobiota bacterium]
MEPGILHDGGFAYMQDLFDDVEFREVVRLGLLGGETFEELRVLLADVLHMAQPVVD